MNPSPYGLCKREIVGRPALRPPRACMGVGMVSGHPCRGRRPRRPAEGSRPLPTMQKIKGRQWQGCGPGMPGPYGLLFPAAGVRGRLAAHNERRQFASQTRSCGCLPRRGKHCSLPSFAALNCGPTRTTPHRVETAAVFFGSFFCYQKKEQLPGRLPFPGNLSLPPR